MATVLLHITEEAQSRTETIKEDNYTCLIGRSSDCGIKLTHGRISRYHCLLEVSGGKVMIRDFGSLNGTYLNKELIGKRPKGMSAEEGKGQQYNVLEVKNGDVLTLANVCDIRVEIKKEQAKRKCLMCGKEITAAETHGLCSVCLAKIAKEFQLQDQKPAQDKKPVQDQKPAKLEKGDIIPGYEKLGSIGEGAMGTVYRVRQRSTGKVMALKTVRKELVKDKSAMDMFLRESGICQQLDHLHVAKQYDIGEYKGMPYILMAYYPNGTLRQYWLTVKNTGKKYAYAMILLRQILAGLHYLHNVEVTVELADGSKKKAKGLVHRDLKPDNIFVEMDGNMPVLKIADFGLAKAFQAAGMTGHTMTGAKMGTLAYMPRQQIINTKYAKPEVDIWAAVASIYDLLTDHYAKPFDNKTEPMKVILTKDATPIRNYDPKVPAEFAALVDKALKDKPSIPYQSAAVLYKEIGVIYDKLY